MTRSVAQSILLQSSISTQLVLYTLAWLYDVLTIGCEVAKLNLDRLCVVLDLLTDSKLIERN